MTRNRLAISTLEPTRYEVAVAINGGATQRLGFTARKTKQGLFAFLGDAAQPMLDAVTAGTITRDSVEDATATYNAALGALHIGPVSIYFTGATERDCAS